MALTLEQRQMLQNLKQGLQKYREEVASGKYKDLPISKRGRMEYKIKHGLELDEPLLNELILPPPTEDN